MDCFGRQRMAKPLDEQNMYLESYTFPSPYHPFIRTAFFILSKTNSIESPTPYWRGDVTS